MAMKFRDFLKEQLRDEEFREEYESLEAEDAIIRAKIRVQEEQGMTLEALSRSAV